jgi:hypothetical protein
MFQVELTPPPAIQSLFKGQVYKDDTEGRGVVSKSQLEVIFQ